MAASENEIVLQSVRKYPSEKAQTIQKLVSEFALEISWLVSTRHNPLPKDICK